DSQTVTESLVVPEEEQTIFLDRPSDAAAKLVSSERSSLALDAGQGTEIEDRSRIERAVPQEFKNRSMELIRSGLRDGGDLSAGAFSVFGRVGTRQNVELAHRVDSQQVAADAARR